MEEDKILWKERKEEVFTITVADNIDKSEEMSNGK